MSRKGFDSLSEGLNGYTINPDKVYQKSVSLSFWCCIPSHSAKQQSSQGHQVIDCLTKSHETISWCCRWNPDCINWQYDAIMCLLTGNLMNLNQWFCLTVFFVCFFLDFKQGSFSSRRAEASPLAIEQSTTREAESENVKYAYIAHKFNITLKMLPKEERLGIHC